VNINRRLREYVTRGFSLSLTHDQIRFMVSLHARDAGSWTAGACATAGNQLLNRGLVGFTDTEDAYLTAAGVHVIGLLKSAGIYAEHAAQLENPRDPDEE
jgi:hypothetical protein